MLVDRLGRSGRRLVYAWKYFSAYESTDDAEVDGHINAISARINGNVIECLAEDEQYVKAGDVLVRIDPRTRVAVAKREPTWRPPKRRPKVPHRHSDHGDHDERAN